LGADCEHGLLFASDGNLDVIAAGAIVKANAVALANGTTYRVRFILYSSGCFYSISGGAFGTLGVTYTALHETISQVTATLYAAISNLNAVTTIDRVQTEAQLYAVTFANYVTDVPYVEAYQLRLLFRLTAGNAWTTKTNWLSATTAATWFKITVAGGRVTKIEPGANNLVGSIATWGFNTFTALTTLNINTNAGLVGSIASWVLPASLVYFYVYSTAVSGSPAFTSAVVLANFQYQNCALPQATVDLIVSRIYARRMSFTFATPSALVGGTNAAPSGVYADEDPPTTGKGFIYELVNDPEVEGFRKWAITYTP
jgi:hypothetical protein